MDGTVSFYAATLRPLGATVTFYGGGVTEGRFGLPALVDLAPALGTPWLDLYGDLDHGFHCNDRPSVFNPADAKDAWQRTLDWFDGHLADGQ